MQSTKGTANVSKKRVWAGRILSALAVLFLIFDGVIKLLKIAPVVESFEHLGYPVTLSRGIGTLELLLIAVYLIPQTSILGAILWTGYLGGATASQLRIGEPLLGYVLFPTYVGLLLWGGLFLRDDRLRALIPPRR